MGTGSSAPTMGLTATVPAWPALAPWPVGGTPGPPCCRAVAALLAAEQLFPGISPFDDLPAALGLQPPPEPSSKGAAGGALIAASSDRPSHQQGQVDRAAS